MQLGNSLTLNDILSDIYFNAKITAATFGNLDTNGNPQDLLRIINKVYKQLQDEIKGINEDFFSEIYTTDLVLTTGGTYPNEYPYPTNFEKIKQIQVAFNPADKTTPLYTEYIDARIVSQSAFSDMSQTTNFDSPVVVDLGTSFLLYPIQDSTAYPVTKGIKIYTIDLQSDLTQNTDTPNIFSNFHDVITWGTLIEVANRLGNQNLLETSASMFKKRVEEMKTFASGHILDYQPSYLEGQNPGYVVYPYGNFPMS